MERNRMIIDVPEEVQVAIKLQAARTGLTTGQVVGGAIEKLYAKRLDEAREALAEQKAGKK